MFFSSTDVISLGGAVRVLILQHDDANCDASTAVKNIRIAQPRPSTSEVEAGEEMQGTYDSLMRMPVFAFLAAGRSEEGVTARDSTVELASPFQDGAVGEMVSSISSFGLLLAERVARMPTLGSRD